MPGLAEPDMPHLGIVVESTPDYLVLWTLRLDLVRVPQPQLGERVSKHFRGDKFDSSIDWFFPQICIFELRMDF